MTCKGNRIKWEVLKKYVDFEVNATICEKNTKFSEKNLS